MREIKVLNLIYHVCPLRKSRERWKWNLEQIVSRIHLFNGTKVVAIAYGSETDPVEDVIQFLDGYDMDFITKQNDHHLRESHTFWDLLERVVTTDESHATFYAHSKGVQNCNEVQRRWAATMYTLLDDGLLIKETLGRVGMMGMGINGIPYLFPGTFWWFHNASLFNKPDWRCKINLFMEQHPGWGKEEYVVEAYPNRHFANDHYQISSNLDITGAVG